MRTIGVITTSRADYGIYYPILKRIKVERKLKLELYVTGMHLSKDFGMTVNQIAQNGFTIKVRVPMAISDEPQGIARSMAQVTTGFASFFKKSRPDILLILGDRYEMHASAMAAVPFSIPMAHIHGGEVTLGAMDDYFRNSMTKLSHLHFATTKDHARRIIQMGEEPWRVKACGAPSLDNLLTMKYLTKAELTRQFQIKFTQNTILATFHPVTMETNNNAAYIRTLLNVLQGYRNESIIFTAPNADTHNRVITRSIKEFIRKNPNSVFIKNFGAAYLSLLKHVSVMVGNSSSGIIEAASFKLPVVNIGTRQEGRVKPKNVIDVGYSAKDIKKGLTKALSNQFHSSLKGLRNPYGDGHAAERIVSTLKTVNLTKLLNKRFHDIK